MTGGEGLEKVRVLWRFEKKPWSKPRTRLGRIWRKNGDEKYG
jgi:hypothetical protein